MAEYLALKAQYAAQATSARGSERGRRAYDLVLISFDEATATVALVSRHRPKSWRWEKCYALRRSAEVDEALEIPRLARECSQTIGGVRYGMKVSEVLATKGNDYEQVTHQDVGSADLIYDDVVVSVRGWIPGSRDGRVIRVAPPRPTPPEE